jgi:hypothetical protein
VGADPVSAALGGVSAIGDIVGSGKQAHSQNQLVGSETGAINSLMQNFFAPGGASSGLSALSSAVPGSITTAQNAISALSGFNGLTPTQLGALSTTLGNSGLSMINTLKGQMGGVANPSQLIQSLYGTNNQNALNATTQLGSTAAAERLGALQSASAGAQGMLGSSVSGLGVSAGMIPSSLGGLSSLAGMYGSPYASLGSSLGDLGNSVRSMLAPNNAAPSPSAPSTPSLSLPQYQIPSGALPQY